jgi:hypothetical protein
MLRPQYCDLLNTANWSAPLHLANKQDGLILKKKKFLTILLRNFVVPLIYFAQLFFFFFNTCPLSIKIRILSLSMRLRFLTTLLGLCVFLRWGVTSSGQVSFLNIYFVLLLP